MRIKKDGTRFAQDLSIQHQPFRKPMDYRRHWHRNVLTALGLITWQDEATFTQHVGDPAPLAKAVAALEELQKFLRGNL